MHVWERERERERQSILGEREREGERKSFGSSFYMSFSSPRACPMQTGLRQERCST